MQSKREFRLKSGATICSLIGLKIRIRSFCGQTSSPRIITNCLPIWATFRIEPSNLRTAPSRVKCLRTSEKLSRKMPHLWAHWLRNSCHSWILWKVSSWRTDCELPWNIHPFATGTSRTINRGIWTKRQKRRKDVLKLSTSPSIVYSFSAPCWSHSCLVFRRKSTSRWACSELLPTRLFFSRSRRIRKWFSTWSLATTNWAPPSQSLEKSSPRRSMSGRKCLEAKEASESSQSVKVHALILSQDHRSYKQTNSRPLIIQ